MPLSIRLHGLGGPEVLAYDEVPAPVPGPGEVRLAVRAIGVNRAEVMYRQGSYFSRPPLPAQLGYEASGEIDALGPGVEGFAVGDHVSVVPALGFSEYGLYGQQVLAPARAVVRNPEGQSWEQAAASWMQYATAWSGLIDAAGLAEGDAVLLPAASSSIGLAATAVGGIIVAYGALSQETTPLPMLALLGRGQTIRGFGLTGAMRRDDKLAAAKAFVGRGLSSGALTPKIARIFPFGQMAEAHRYMEANTHIGKIVVTV